jgi:hypothetical protein
LCVVLHLPIHPAQKACQIISYRLHTKQKVELTIELEITRQAAIDTAGSGSRLCMPTESREIESAEAILGLLIPVAFEKAGWMRDG